MNDSERPVVEPPLNKQEELCEICMRVIVHKCLVYIVDPHRSASDGEPDTVMLRLVVCKACAESAADSLEHARRMAA